MPLPMTVGDAKPPKPKLTVQSCGLTTLPRVESNTSDDSPGDQFGWRSLEVTEPGFRQVGCAPNVNTSRTQIWYGPAERPFDAAAYATSSPSDAKFGSAIRPVAAVSCCAPVPSELLVQRWPLRT